MIKHNSNEDSLKITWMNFYLCLFCSHSVTFPPFSLSVPFPREKSPECPAYSQRDLHCCQPLLKFVEKSREKSRIIGGAGSDASHVGNIRRILWVAGWIAAPCSGDLFIFLGLFSMRVFRISTTSFWKYNYQRHLIFLRFILLGLDGPRMQVSPHDRIWCPWYFHRASIITQPGCVIKTLQFLIRRTSLDLDWAKSTNSSEQICHHKSSTFVNWVGQDWKS